MNDIVFSPSTWRSGGSAIQSAAQSWGTRANGLLEAISKPIEGADQCATLADMAVATICPVVGGVLAEMVNAIVESLDATAANMTETAVAYEQTEADNAALAAQIMP